MVLPGLEGVDTVVLDIGTLQLFLSHQQRTWASLKHSCSRPCADRMTLTADCRGYRLPHFFRQGNSGMSISLVLARSRS